MRTKSSRVAMALAFVLAASVASAGTVYLNFDDGGAALPEGTTLGTGGWGDPAFADGALVLSGGGPVIKFPNDWISGQTVTMEFTIPNMMGCIPAERGGTGWQEGSYNAGWKFVQDTFCIMGNGLLCGYLEIVTSHIGMVDCGNAYAGADFDIEGACAQTTGFRVTIKCVMDAEAQTMTAYYAYGDDATTPTQRATNWTLLYSFSDVVFDHPEFWGIQSFGVSLLVDDVIIESSTAPDYGTAPPLPQADVPEISVPFFQD